MKADAAPATAAEANFCAPVRSPSGFPSMNCCISLFVPNCDAVIGAIERMFSCTEKLAVTVQQLHGMARLKLIDGHFYIETPDDTIIMTKQAINVKILI